MALRARVKHDEGVERSDIQIRLFSENSVYNRALDLKGIHMTDKMTFTEARANLGSLIDRVASDNDVVVISRKNSADVALISAAELSSLQETAHLFSSPANAKRLMSALKRAKTKKIKPCSVDSLRHEMGV